MSVKTTFTVNSITRTQAVVWKDGTSHPQEVQTVKFFPVTGSGATGAIELGGLTPEAGQAFELNKKYQVEFTLIV